jgi:hypothetical protein
VPADCASAHPFHNAPVIDSRESRRRPESGGQTGGRTFPAPRQMRVSHELIATSLLGSQVRRLDWFE